MNRFFYIAAALVVISMCIEQAQAVPLSPAFAYAASAPRFSDNAGMNINRTRPSAPATPASTRCKDLQSSIDAAVASPDRKTVVTRKDFDGRPIVSQSVVDKRGERELQAQSLGCPQ